MDARYPAQDFLHRLVDAGSDLGRQLVPALDLPLRAYLRGLIPAGPAAWNRHLGHLTEGLARYLRDRGQPDIDGVCSRFLAAPVIQQADHSHLLLDREVFLNNFLFALACREAGVPQMITSQCSTVSCLSRREPISGPVFLRTRGRLYRILPFSNRTLKDSSFCALPGPMVMTFDDLQAGATPADDPVLGRFIGRRIEDAVLGYRACNDEIWNCLSGSELLPRVGVDESLASEVVALHLEDPSSPLRALIFDPPVRDCFLEVKRQMVSARENLAVNRASPDFFWYRKGSRLVPVILAGMGKAAAFVLETQGTELPVPPEPFSLARALREGVVYADRILAYFVRCLLPGVVAVGGTSQQDYVWLYQRMFAECQQRVPFLDEADATRITRIGASRLGGAPLLELDEEQQRLLTYLGPDTKLCDFANAFLDELVGRTIGRLDCASYFEQLMARARTRESMSSLRTQC